MSQANKQWGLYVGLIALGCGLGLGSNRFLAQRPEQTTRSQPVVLPSPVSSLPVQPSADPQDLNFIARAVNRVGPAVVRIDAAQRVSDSDIRQPFRRFFGEELPLPSDRFNRGTGSGFILRTDGRIITNAHVVEGSDTVRVTLRDGQQFEGRVLGLDPVTDVAIVEIEAANLPTVEFGQAEALTPGEWAIAIGNPLGLDNTVTVGIISALDRSSSQVGVPDKRVRFIQTDAAINPGNSGGPLLNAQGEVIGINTAIRADAQGLGFAIPIETAQRIAEQLIANGRADHPYLGIHMITLTATARKELNKSPDLQFKIGEDAGVLVVRVVEGSPAERGGFQPGDVIQKVGGAAVTTAVEVQEQVDASTIGDSLTVEVLRNQKVEVLTVRPGVFPKNG
ncbi:MAG: HhoA/HhoB/HtrA family serine endopeptidase [Cyanobacteria bacterium P01_H01_bin.15]